MKTDSKILKRFCLHFRTHCITLAGARITFMGGSINGIPGSDYITQFWIDHFENEDTDKIDRRDYNQIKTNLGNFFAGVIRNEN